ncbi:MAG: nucleotidyltransferase [Clostridia bacterium]|nr:nucleotidyltransferase [Clostridia bacterium]
MKVLGLIVEYNPFHNGHLYHLEQSKKLSGADYTVCVMSGNLIQRGEPAIVNKWARTKMALLSGADLVIELPVVYAMSSAEFFAYGAVKILDSLGVINSICFGSENGRIDELDMIAGVLYKEPDEYRSLLKNALDSGVSYPAARESALRKYLGNTASFVSDIDKIISSSNNILGIEYLKALKKLESKIEPLTIGRVNNSYNTEQLTGHISSATSIRKYILDNSDYTDAETLKNTLPQTSFSVLEEEFESGRGPVFAYRFQDIILAVLRQITTEQIKVLPYVSEGLENRIKHAAAGTGSLSELLERIVTKRYTRTRIQRTLFSTLTGLTTPEFETFNKYGGPQYIRILGFNKNGRKLLSHINKNATLPVIVKTADFKTSCNPLLKRMLEIEAISTDLYVLGYQNSHFKKAGQEFTQNIIRI